MKNEIPLPPVVVVPEAPLVGDPVPTQLDYPWKAALRTGIQTAAGILLSLVTFIAGAAIFLPQLLTAIGEFLPPEWLGYLTAAVVFVSTLSLAVSRVMNIPGVNDFLTKLKLGAQPKILDGREIGGGK